MPEPVIFDSSWEFQCGLKTSKDFQTMLNHWRHEYLFVFIMCEHSVIDGTIRYVIARKPR